MIHTVPRRFLCLLSSLSNIDRFSISRVRSTVYAEMSLSYWRHETITYWLKYIKCDFRSSRMPNENTWKLKFIVCCVNGPCYLNRPSVSFDWGGGDVGWCHPVFPNCSSLLSECMYISVLIIINNNGGHLYTVYPALALSGLQSIITLVLHVCVHLFNGQATYYTIGAHITVLWHTHSITKYPIVRVHS